MMEHILIKGDPTNPLDTDIIAQLDRLEVGKPVPSGWNVMTGNPDSSLIGRVLMRVQIGLDEIDERLRDIKKDFVIRNSK